MPYEGLVLILHLFKIKPILHNSLVKSHLERQSQQKNIGFTQMSQKKKSLQFGLLNEH